MDFLKNVDARPGTLFKYAGIILLGLIIVTFAIHVVGLATDVLFRSSTRNHGYDGSHIEEQHARSNSKLSLRNIASEPAYDEEYASGDDAEAFEITEYSSTIKSGDAEDDCEDILELKKRPEVVFESSNMHERGCSFSFKVKNDSVQDVLAFIQEYDPESLNASTQTIKRQIEDYTNEVEVLLNKRKSIDETLQGAIAAYDEVTELATRALDVESLAKVIDSKISLIERLTQERIRVNEQLDRLERSKAEQLDRLDYTYFRVHVYEYKYIDTESIKESWQRELKSFVYNVNSIVQGMSIHLIEGALRIIQFAVYALILLFVVKYGWKIGKYVWKR